MSLNLPIHWKLEPFGSFSNALSHAVVVIRCFIDEAIGVVFQCVAKLAVHLPISRLKLLDESEWDLDFEDYESELAGFLGVDEGLSAFLWLS